MRTTLLVVLVASLSLWPLQTQSFSQTSQGEVPWTSGNAFVRLCSVAAKDVHTVEESRNNIACVSFVKGVVQGVEDVAEYTQALTGKEPLSPFCVPDGVENGQMVSITLGFVRNHPENADLPTSTLIIGALGTAFPCKK